MSERGSFVTEYIYCPECFKVVCDVLVKNEKHLKGVVIPSWQGNGIGLPIIAGKIGDNGMQNELIAMQYLFGIKISERLCHPVRIAVLADSGGSEIFVIEPNTKTK